MKCSNCGMDNIVNDAVHCPNCGASLITPANWDNQQPAQQPQYQQQPQQAPPQYQQLPPQYNPPAKAKTQYVSTVKNVGMTEVLLIFSGLMFLMSGFGNLSSLTYRGYSALYPLLGIMSLLVGLIFLAYVLMPSMLKSMEKMMGFLILGLSVLFFFWGMAALFGDNIGWYGAEIVGAGLAGLAAAALKMGFIK